MERSARRKSKLNTRSKKMILWCAGTIFAVPTAWITLVTINVAPFRAFGGAVWFKNGAHYMGNTQISVRLKQIDAPKEASLAAKIKDTTPSCTSLDEGFCQESPGDYVIKSLITPAIAYTPGTPDKKITVGYCTVCNDGSYSPSCAVGRGACSWHGGVEAYNAPEYKTIPGTPAIEAKPAVYSYISKSYKDSPIYESPDIPNLKTVVGY